MRARNKCVCANPAQSFHFGLCRIPSRDNWRAQIESLGYQKEEEAKKSPSRITVCAELLVWRSLELRRSGIRPSQLQGPPRRQLMGARPNLHSDKLTREPMEQSRRARFWARRALRPAHVRRPKRRKLDAGRL